MRLQGVVVGFEVEQRQDVGSGTTRGTGRLTRAAVVGECRFPEVAARAVQQLEVADVRRLCGVGPANAGRTPIPLDRSISYQSGRPRKGFDWRVC